MLFPAYFIPLWHWPVTFWPKLLWCCPIMHLWCKFGETVSNTLQDTVLTMFLDARMDGCTDARNERTGQKQYASGHSTLGGGVKIEYLASALAKHVRTTCEAADCCTRVQPTLYRNVRSASVERRACADTASVTFNVTLQSTQAHNQLGVKLNTTSWVK